MSIFQNRGLSEADINNFLVSNDDIDCQEPLTDEDIIRQVTDEQDNENEEELETSESVARIPLTQAVSCLNTCLEWADEVDISIPEKMLLRKLRDKAFSMSLNTTRQSTILEFFKKV